MRKLLIKQGGILELEELTYSEELEKQTNTTTDVTLSSPKYIMETCNIESGVTLRDVFIIIKVNIDLYSIILQNWVEEFVEEGLNPKEKLDPASDVDYIEIGWNMRADRGFEDDETLVSFGGHLFPDCYGRGLIEDNGEQYEGSIGISLLNTSQLLDVPIKISSSTTIFLEEYRELEIKDLIKVDKCDMTLFHVLYAIVWEISFYGPPSKRDLRKKELNTILEDLHSVGTADGPYEIVWEALQILDPNKGEEDETSS